MTKRKHVSPDELFAEALASHKAGRLTDAEGRYRRLLKLKPGHARARYLLGTLLSQAGDASAAIIEIEHAIKQDPNVPAMYVNLAGAYLAAGRAGDAVTACRNAIRREPSSQAYFNLGEALRTLEDWTGATEAYESYVRLCPTDAVGFLALGDTLKRRGRLDAAMVAFETALVYMPDRLEAYIGIADVLLLRGCHHAAYEILEDRRKAGVSHPDVLRRIGEIELTLGRLASGWDKFDEGRFGSAGGVARRPTPPPYWQGESLTGKRLIVWNEQGIGDECLYASILPDVIARAAHCIVACSERMAPVYARSFPTAEIRAWDGRQLPVSAGDKVDLQIASGSIGRFLRRDFASFPRHAGYLKANVERAAELRKRYRARSGGRPVVGFAWTSKHAVPGSAKYTEVLRFKDLLTVPGVMFVNLQYGDRTEELASVRSNLGVEIFHDENIDQVADIDEFFAQVFAMDLVVSTSNSTAHVAGSMSVPTWLLLPADRGAPWYWFHRKADCPWYPSALIIRTSTSTQTDPWEINAARDAGAQLMRWIAGAQGKA